MKNKTSQLEIPSLEQLEKERIRYITQNKFKKTFLNTFAILIVVIALSIIITMLLLPVYRICGSSMSTTLENGDIVLAVKGHYVQQGDLVAFYYGNNLLIKRVIAEPGDVVDIKDQGDVYINGNLLNEPYLKTKAYGDSDSEYPLRVMEEHWFLMGDNREISIDSRNSEIGCVSEEQIAGKVCFRIWPLNKIGKLGN